MQCALSENSADLKVGVPAQVHTGKISLEVIEWPALERLGEIKSDSSNARHGQPKTDPRAGEKPLDRLNFLESGPAVSCVKKCQKIK